MYKSVYYDKLKLNEIFEIKKLGEKKNNYEFQTQQP